MGIVGINGKGRGGEDLERGVLQEGLEGVESGRRGGLLEVDGGDAEVVGTGEAGGRGGEVHVRVIEVGKGGGEVNGGVGSGLAIFFNDYLDGEKLGGLCMEGRDGVCRWIG